MSTLAEIVSTGSARLAAAGVPSARHDAETLAEHVWGVRRSRLPLHQDCSPAQAARYDDLVTRRADREPLQHLTGAAHFRFLQLAVGPGVFLPRPETEVLVDWCLPRLRPGHTVVDLGSGSGAIALALVTEAPGIRGYAVEADPAAFRWLARNVADVATRSGPVDVDCLPVDLSDLLAAAPQLAGAVDLVVSNPPYIPQGAWPLEPEVARYDPPIALWGGVDGLDVVRAVERIARRLLTPGGWLAFEHADVQGPAALGLVATAGGWADVTDHRDLAGRDRFLTATWIG